MNESYLSKQIEHGQGELRLVPLGENEPPGLLGRLPAEKDAADCSAVEKEGLIRTAFRGGRSHAKIFGRGDDLSGWLGDVSHDLRSGRRRLRRTLRRRMNGE